MVDPCCPDPAGASGDPRFVLVGAGYRARIPRARPPSPFRRLRRLPLFSLLLLALIVLSCAFAPLLTRYDPRGYSFDALNQPPGPEHPFGTATLGRDLQSILLHGGRASLIIGVLGAAILSTAGILYGSISGTSRDLADGILMRLVELVSSIPSLLLVLIVTAVFPARNVPSMSVVIGLTGWMGLSRIVRSEVRQIRNAEYVLYARASGGGFVYVTFRHLVPGVLSAILFVIISGISSCISMESTLSFLGLGLPVDELSWGSILSLANRALLTNSWWLIVLPGLFLVTTLLCITRIGSHLRRENARKSRIL